MSVRDWLHNAAIAGVMIPAILLLLFLSGPEPASQLTWQPTASRDQGAPHSNANTKQQNQAANESRGGRAAQVGGTISPPSADEVAKKNDPDADSAANKIARDANEIALRDLAAQQAMAKATVLMNRAAWVSAILTLIAVILLWRTLVYTSRAAAHTKVAADAATKAANAALSSARYDREANELLRGNAKLELRAYISVEPAGAEQLMGQENGIGLVEVRNVGKLPARNVSVFVKMETASWRRTDFPVPPDEEGVTRVIQPGATMRQGSDEHIPIGRLIVHSDYVFVWGVVYYDDGYDRRRFTRFCHRYSGASSGPRLPGDNVILAKEKARYHTHGNEAN